MKSKFLVLNALMVLALLLGACTTAAPQTAPLGADTNEFLPYQLSMVV